MKHISHFIRCDGCGKESRHKKTNDEFNFDRLEGELLSQGWFINVRVDGSRQEGTNKSSGYILGGDFCCVQCLCKSLTKRGAKVARGLR